MGQSIAGGGADCRRPATEDLVPLLRLRRAAIIGPEPLADGRANAAVLRVLAGALGARRRDLQIVRGDRSRDKTVRVGGLDAATVVARLDATRL